jgi:hypothetical protein
VPAARHQPDLFAADNQRRQKLSPLIDLINDRYGRCAIGFAGFRRTSGPLRAMPPFTVCRSGGSFDGYRNASARFVATAFSGY